MKLKKPRENRKAFGKITKSVAVLLTGDSQPILFPWLSLVTVSGGRVLILPNYLLPQHLPALIADFGIDAATGAGVKVLDHPCVLMIAWPEFFSYYLEFQSVDGFLSGRLLRFCVARNDVMSATMR